MERMKIEIEKSEYDRLKSREEKLMAYYEWFVDKENDLATVEDIVNENIELHNTIEDIYKENRKLLGEKVRLKTLSNHKTDVITGLGKNLDELEEENKKLKKERDLYKARNEELNENCFGLAKENENLKSDLSECECSFGFENDEVGFWKLEYKRLKKWIKDHCNGYGNLFPEDEMKRQWKKADKKRK